MDCFFLVDCIKDCIDFLWWMWLNANDGVCLNCDNIGNSRESSGQNQRQEKGIQTRVVRGPLPGSLLHEGSHQVVLRLFSHHLAIYDCHYTQIVVSSGKSTWRIAKNPQELLTKILLTLFKVSRSQPQSVVITTSTFLTVRWRLALIFVPLCLFD